MTARSASLPATCRGKLLLLLLCAVQFLDVVDSSIMNVAQLSIRRDLGHRPRAGDLLRHRHRAHYHAARPAHGHPRRPGQVPGPELADQPSSVATPRRPAVNR